MSALNDLLAYDRETQALGQIAGRLGWDQETMMPKGSAEQRAAEMSALEGVLHARRTAPEVGDWLEAAGAGDLDPVAAAKLREIGTAYARATKVPARLAKALAEVTTRSHRIWIDARAKEDFGAFAPILAEVLALRQEEATCLAEGGDAYSALLNDYEPGTSGQEIADLFDALRPRLVALADRIKGADTPPALTGSYDPDLQLRLCQDLAQRFGYSMDHGRIDRAVHPFSSGSGADVRITTRTDPADPFNCIFSTIHEVGHGCYEQNVDAAYRLTALGRGVSMGVHESQSRIYENQLGRSRAFSRFLYGRMQDIFGDVGAPDAEALYATVNRVRPGFIRTEADEVHYNLHIMLRFDLERDLIAGKLSVADLPEAWNTRFAADFGQAVDKPSNGVLQDVHWAAGLIGYFPTYTLGNVYAGCLYAALRRDVPDLDAQIETGDLAQATGWLRDNLQQHGALRPPVETITHATGHAPSVEPLLSYLEAKFGDLYGL